MIKLFLIGLLVGTINGLLGSGAGMVLVPALIIFKKFSAYSARGTSLFILLFSSMVSLISYLNYNVVDYSLVIKLVIGGMIGGFIGAKFVDKIPPRILRISFGAFMIFTGIRLWMR